MRNRVVVQEQTFLGRLIVIRRDTQIPCNTCVVQQAAKSDRFMGRICACSSNNRQTTFSELHRFCYYFHVFFDR
ncbi:Uncharacterised protein [Vibrio cholerae]|nr:Uncharacterised protein [Vibrio cholerae]CSB28118.1 Uncharacterised protein [Vibrio cholerae]CSC77891.1 Uncharacterised protein [Vibrio cholerae]